MKPEPSLFPPATSATAPLAHRMRPTTLDAYRGQAHLLGPDKPLRAAIERGATGSMVFWISAILAAFLLLDLFGLGR